MKTADYAKLGQLSPFELKDQLTNLASSHAERLMLNAEFSRYHPASRLLPARLVRHARGGAVIYLHAERGGWSPAAGRD